MRYIIIYFILISFITILFTCYDKSSAKNGARRVSEKTLFLLAFFGGSIAEYFTMKAIRHKTLHKRFMIGLPAIIIMQILLIFSLTYFIQNVNM